MGASVESEILSESIKEPTKRLLPYVLPSQEPQHIDDHHLCLEGNHQLHSSSKWRSWTDSANITFNLPQNSGWGASAISLLEKWAPQHCGIFNPVFLATVKSIYKSCDSAITSAWLYFWMEFSAPIWRFSVQSLLDRFHYDSSTKTYFWGKCKSNCLCTTCFNLQPFRVHIVERR